MGRAFESFSLWLFSCDPGILMGQWMLQPSPPLKMDLGQGVTHGVPFRVPFSLLRIRKMELTPGIPLMVPFPKWSCPPPRPLHRAYRRLARAQAELLSGGQVLAFTGAGISKERFGSTQFSLLFCCFAYLLKTQLFNFLGNMGYMSVQD